jgi:hypothetical protein
MSDTLAELFVTVFPALCLCFFIAMLCGFVFLTVFGARKILRLQISEALKTFLLPLFLYGMLFLMLAVLSPLTNLIESVVSI